MASHANLGAFASAMRSKAQKLDGAVAGVVRDAALAIVEEVAKDTPYLTGQAQSNWLTAIGAPFPYYIANETSNSGWRDSLDQAKLALAGSKADDVIHITNNLPYIVKLNQGTSTQAPALFVQLAIVRARYRLKGATIDLI